MGVKRLGMPCSVPDELSLSTELIMFFGQSSCFKRKSFFRECQRGHLADHALYPLLSPH